jgi:hypothetical protein
MSSKKHCDKPRSAGADAKDSDGVLSHATTRDSGRCRERSQARMMKHAPALATAGLSAGLGLVVLGAASSPALAAPGVRGPAPASVAATSSSACLIGGSAVAGGCADSIADLENALVRLAADRIDGVLGAVADSTKALGDAYARLAADDDQVPPERAPWLARRTAQGSTTGFRTCPAELSSPPAFQAPYPGFYSYRGEALGDAVLYFRTADGIKRLGTKDAVASQSAEVSSASGEPVVTGRALQRFHGSSRCGQAPPARGTNRAHRLARGTHGAADTEHLNPAGQRARGPITRLHEKPKST